jgi:hypothetical protein
MKIEDLPFKLMMGGATIALLVIGYDITVRSLNQQANHEVLYCHPDGADLGHNGNVFVSLTSDKKAITVSHFDSAIKPAVIKLSRPAHDVLMLSNQDIILSYGASGEVGLLNIESGQPEQFIKLGNFSGAMCRTAVSQALIIDPAAGKIYQFDLASKSVIHTHSIAGKPAHMKWLVPESELALFDSKGQSLGTINPAMKAADGQ